MAGLTDEIPTPMPKNEWLTTAEVMDKYGYDPSKKPTESGLKSKLVNTRIGTEVVQVRVWLKDTVEPSA